MAVSKRVRKMNPEVKALWLEALRSGRFPQTDARLCNISPEDGSRSYCCLGVLSELAIENGVPVVVKDFGPATEPWWVSDSLHDLRRYDRSIHYAPTKVQDWAGIDSHGYLPEDSDYDSLAEANDSGVEFDGIADLIEKYL